MGTAIALSLSVSFCTNATQTPIAILLTLYLLVKVRIISTLTLIDLSTQRSQLFGIVLPRLTMSSLRQRFRAIMPFLMKRMTK
jgi:hypothetical protein